MLKKVISIFLFVFLIGISSIGAAERIEGTDRYATAVEISKVGWKSSEYIILANGSRHPDALAGGPLAYYYNAPILLTNGKNITAGTKNEIARLKASKVIVLGGTGVISSNIVKEMEHLGLKVRRIGGKDRYETAELISRELNSKEAVVANGSVFPDALSIAPYAARNGIPILLTRSDSLPNSTEKGLAGKEKVIIVGGLSAVGKQVEGKFNNSVRYGGKDRYETGKNIVQNLEIGKEVAFIATGESFPDALTGSVLAAKMNAPILLVKKNSIPISTNSMIPSYESIYILGGESAVSKNVLIDLEKKPTFTARGIAIGHSETKVLATLGQPDRIEPSREKFDWFVYNSDYTKFLMVGMKEGTVVSLQSNADVWESTIGIKIGTESSVVVEKLANNKWRNIDNRYTGTFLYDSHNENRVMTIILMENDFEYLEPRTSKEVAKAQDRQVFDMTNASRALYDLKPFKWHEKAANVARMHSQDMNDRDYFSHNSLDGETPWDRLEKAGIKYSRAGENIAAGHYDSSSVHLGWMNSYGHRMNILSENTHLGVGTVFGNGSFEVYYTQVFLTPID